MFGTETDLTQTLHFSIRAGSLNIICTWDQGYFNQREQCCVCNKSLRVHYLLNLTDSWNCFYGHFDVLCDDVIAS